MKFIKLPKAGFDQAYFKSIRNWYHPVIGISINYFFSILIFCNRVEFPLSYKYCQNYLYPFLCSVPAFFAGFIGEKVQDKITGKDVSDMRDVYFTWLPSLIGGYLSMWFVSWYLGVFLIITALLLIVFKFKK